MHTPIVIPRFARYLLPKQQRVPTRSKYNSMTQEPDLIVDFMKTAGSKFDKTKNMTLYEDLADQIRLQSASASAQLKLPPITDEVIEKIIGKAVASVLKRSGKSTRQYLYDEGKEHLEDIYRPIAAELAYQHIQTGMDEPLIPTQMENDRNVERANNLLCRLMLKQGILLTGISGTKVMDDLLNDPNQLAQLKKDVRIAIGRGSGRSME